MRDHDLAVLRITARRDEGRAVTRRVNRRRIHRMLLLIQPRNVVLTQLHRPVQSHNVPYIDLDASRLRACGNALQLRLVLLANVRPEHLLRRIPKEPPVALRAVNVFHLEDVKGIGDLRSKQVAVLEPHFFRTPFEVDVGPPAPLEAVTTSQPGILEFSGAQGRSRRDQNGRCCKEKYAKRHGRRWLPRARIRQTIHQSRRSTDAIDWHHPPILVPLHL